MVGKKQVADDDDQVVTVSGGSGFYLMWTLGAGATILTLGFGLKCVRRTAGGA